MRLKGFCSLILVVILLTLSGCSNDAKGVVLPGKYTLPQEKRTVKSGVVADNDNVELEWDAENLCVIFKEKSTGNIWSTMPYNYYLSDKNGSKYVNDGICSAIRVIYIDSEKNTEVELNSYSDATYTLATKLKNGLKLTYYFDTVGISIPIMFLLEEDGVSVTLDIKGITESENRVYKITLLPFLSSAANSKVNYLFVPSGSGALLYADDTRDPRLYSERVFGHDLADPLTYKTSEAATVHLPVFGAKDTEKSIFSVITSGADIAEISAVAGDSNYGYSGVSASFYVRGKSSTSLKGAASTNSNLIKYSDGIVALSSATVRYYFLKADKSDYNGMVECYRKHLLENENLKSGVENKDLLLTLYGGGEIEKFILGIPYNDFESMTTISQAKKIVSDILSETDASLAVNLKGFGIGGLDNTNIAGGFKIESEAGSKKELSDFLKWSKGKDIDAFLDFNMTDFNKNSNGFSTRKAATNVNLVRFKHYDYNTVILDQNANTGRYLNGRYNLATSGSLMIKKAKDLELSGIGLSSLANISYSDYNSPNYYCKANMSVDVERILNMLSKNGYKTFGESPNSYAAVNLDYIFNSPTSSSKYKTIDLDIPFYQMVFRGSAVISGGVINLSANPETEFLNSVSTGSSLAFSVCNNTDIKFIRGNHTVASLSVYDDISSQMKNFISKAKPLFERLDDATITSYERNGDISTTLFENGLVICVNYSDKDIETQFGNIPARSFIYQ